MKRIEIKVGDEYSRLSIVEETDKIIQPNGSVKRRFIVKCICGSKPFTVSLSNLRNGHTQSCGCLHSEISIRVNTTHGEYNKNYKSKEYVSWYSMKQRCYNPNNIRFLLYGGRGIVVCERWLNSYENFLEDMGRRPEGRYSIDRIDNDGNYEPYNCRWATDKEQAQNKKRGT